MTLLLATWPLAFQPALMPTLPVSAHRATPPSMEARLNNYVLPGPMTPIGNQVMIKLRKVDDKTTGGLFVPTAEAEKPKEGVVVLAGPGSANADTGAMVTNPVKEGDLVMLRDFVGEKVDYNGEQHVFCDADSLLGYFEGSSLTVDAFKPLGDLVMVAMADMETETSTGIALAGMEDEEGNSGEVVAVGPGKHAANGELLTPNVAKGDNVMYVRHAGAEATVEGKNFILVPEADCFCKW
jgi:chaperonin GroES